MTTVEDSAARPVARELRDARERAVGALIAAGATVRSVALRSWRSAILPFLAALQAGSVGAGGPTTICLLIESGEPAPDVAESPARSPRPYGLDPGHAGQRTAPGAGRLSGSAPDAGHWRGDAAELLEAIGDGVLLHPAHPRSGAAPRRTCGRPWLVTPAAVFNLAGVPVTEVPLGRSQAGLPLGDSGRSGGRSAISLSIAVALELEAVFGGFRPTGRADQLDACGRPLNARGDPNGSSPASLLAPRPRPGWARRSGRSIRPLKLDARAKVARERDRTGLVILGTPHRGRSSVG